MDMENEASWAMDQLRAANKASDEGKFLAKQQQQYVSQFRIDGQPILPPLMTADRRQQMWQLKQRALQLEAKYKQQAQCDTSSSSNTSSMSTVQRILPQQQRLQQTPTYIYDSTQQDALLETPRSRPQTLQLKSGSSNSCGSNNSCGSSNKNCGSNTNCGIPSICVNPPTPLEPNPSLSLSPSANASRLQLGHTRRKLNNITSRIMRFERQADNDALPLQVLWQDKRMLRSSTSPALLLPQPEASGQQMQRSRSFTLDEPSPALLAHMQRVGQQQMEQQQQQQQVATTVTATSPRNPRLVHATQSLAHLRRDTIESKAKQVQRSASSSLVSATTTSPATSRRCGGNSPQRSLQQQQQYLKQLLQRALHEADDVCDEQSQQERKHLTLAKRQMFKDIKLAHRDRFQQLVQYQHEEQRRMQAEFDRQQKFLIEQICADINVAVYANESTSPQAATAASSLAAPTSSTSACTSTADLSPNCTSTARKRLFDGADTESDVPSEMLPLDSVATTKSQSTPNHNNNNSSSSSASNKSKLKKSQQLQQQRKLPSPVQPKTPPARRVINKTTTSLVGGRTKPQQQQTTTTTTSLSKTRRAASPSRQSLPTAASQQRREEAATLLCAATRGFLVRRLFRTEQVQRIVQTIRDTLIFVLNLHMETTIGGIDQEEPANIRLKARLLQQLCSASRTLHLIFFQTSIKERMEIIARDRKRIKTKLMALHVKQRH